MYGRIPKVYGKGNDARKLWDLLKAMGKEESTANNHARGAIDQLIILDRSIDLMSVLATQHTYEGLIGRFNILVCHTTATGSLDNYPMLFQFQMKCMA